MASLIDVAASAKLGLIAAAARQPTGKRRRSPDRPVIERAQAGTLACAADGAGHVFPSARTAAVADGFVDTGFTCRRRGNDAWPSPAPAGMAAIGGYRFRRRLTLDAWPTRPRPVACRTR